MNTHHVTLKRICGVIFALALCLVASLTVSAAAGKTGSIKLHYVLDSCTFRIYRVADYDSQGGYKLTSAFSSLPVDWTQMDDEDWYDLASTLSTMVTSNSISATKSAQTNSSGDVSFTSLSQGLYLVTADQMTKDNTSYTVQPLIIAVPGVEGDGTVSYDREATVSKYTTKTLTTYTSISVHKVWSGDDTSVRPKSIKVKLLRDGKVYRTATLKKSNSWRKKWSKLDASYTWTVVEKKVPSGYKVSYSGTDTAIIVKNKYTKKTTQEKKSSSGKSDDKDDEDSKLKTDSLTDQTPGGNKNLTDATPSGSSNPSGSSSGLPQTGLNWMPVMILVPVGLLCLVIGMIRRRRSEGKS